MGTHACIEFYIGKTYICSVYHQYDGYPEGVGQDLVNYIKSKKFVSGIGEDENVFNGAQCFIAQYIRDHKEKAGGMYMRNKWSRKNGGESYVYKVTLLHDNDSRRVNHVQIKIQHGRLPRGFEREIDL